MGFARRVICTALIAGAAAIPIPAVAEPTLDQVQPNIDNFFTASTGGAVWQTFTPGISGMLTSVDVLGAKSACTMGVPPCPAFDLQIRIVATSAGMPSGTVLASATLPVADVSLAGWENVALDPAPVITAGTLYAIHLTSDASNAMTQDVVEAGFLSFGNTYAAGTLLVDVDPLNGLDDPESSSFPSGDLAFRTYVDDVICGDGIQASEEACEDGNAVDGDGCSAECEIEECGNGAIDFRESCDDGNTTTGDGCDADCALEPNVVACQAAIAKAGLRLVSGTLAAIQKCRTSLAQGKTLSIDDPAQCAAETGAAKSIAKVRLQARRYFAEGRKPKCTNAAVAMLGACADSVDGLIGTGAEAGCLLTEHDEAVATALEAEYGY